MPKKNYIEHKFKNGATLLYKRRNLCNATALCAGFACGHLYAEEMPGIAHFFEHMLFKGTNKRTLEQIAEDRKNITHLNAYTNFHHMCVNFYDSNSKIEECLEYASDVLFNSTFDEQYIKNELKVIFEEKARKINESLKSVGYLHGFFLRPQLPSYDFIFGEESVLGRVTSQDLAEYRNKHYVSDKFVIGVSSSLSFSKIKKLVKKYFINKLKTSTVKSVFKDDDKQGITQNQGLNIITDPALKTLKANISIKFPCEKYEFRENYEYDFIANKFRRDKDSFHQQVRENGLSYTTSAYFYNIPDVTNNCILFEFETSKLENFDKILKILGNSIKTIKQNGASEDELKIMKDNILYDLDCDMPSSYRRTTDNMLRKLAKNDTYNKKFTRKFVKKLLKKTNSKTMHEYIDRIFDKNNDIHITILSPFEESEFKTVKEYKEMIFTK